MKIVKQITKTIEEIIVTCDICGGQANHICRMCRKDVCNSHTVSDYQDCSDYSDCSDTYCVECWSIGEKYRKELDNEMAKHDYKIASIHTLWKEECLTKTKEEINK